MNIISLINVKGGVGKTITSINLAGAISKKGRNVLLIDNDPQSSITQILDIDTENINTMYDLYLNNKIGFNECITKYSDNFYVIPNNIKSAILENTLQNKISRESILKNKKNTIPDGFDYVIIDNSPFIGVLVKNSFGMSDYYIEIVDNCTSALQGLNMVNEVIEEIKDSGLNEDIKLLGTFRNNFDKTTNYSKQFGTVLEKRKENDLFKSIAYNSIKYKEATATNKIIQEYSPVHAEVYNNLLLEIDSRIK